MDHPRRLRFGGAACQRPPPEHQNCGGLGAVLRVHHHFQGGKERSQLKGSQITAEYNGEQTTYALNHEKYCIWQHSHKDVAEWYRYAVAELMGGKLNAYKTWAGVSVSFGPLNF